MDPRISILITEIIKNDFVEFERSIALAISAHLLIAQPTKAETLIFK